MYIALHTIRVLHLQDIEEGSISPKTCPETIKKILKTLKHGGGLMDLL